MNFAKLVHTDVQIAAQFTRRKVFQFRSITHRSKQLFAGACFFLDADMKAK